MTGTSIIQIDPMITPDKTFPNKRTAIDPVDVISLKMLNGNIAGDGSMYFFKYLFRPAFLIPKNGTPNNTIDANAIVTVKGAGFTKPNVINAKFGKLEAGGNSFAYAFNPTSITVLDDNTVTCKVSAAEDPDQTDENLSSDSAAGNIVLRLYTQMTRSNDLVAHYVA